MIGSLVGKIVGVLRQQGARGFARRMLSSIRRLPRSEFDLKRGTETGDIVPLWRLRIASPNARFGVRYQAVDEQDVVAAVGSLNEDIGRFTFIDLGCGKGRGLLVAVELGFGRVLGVEFAPQLAETARANLQKTGAANALVIAVDAAEYVFPAGNLVVFLYNPFGAEVMRPVIANLRRSDSRSLYVIYVRPVHAALFDEADFLEPLGSPAGRPNIQIWRRRAGR